MFLPNLVSVDQNGTENYSLDHKEVPAKTALIFMGFVGIREPEGIAYHFQPVLGRDGNLNCSFSYP